MFKAGAAQVVITPPVGSWLAGYFAPRVSVGVHDDLYAHALVLDDGSTRLALVSCDLILISRDHVEAARAIIQSEVGIPPEHVLISATHTHTGPYTAPILGQEAHTDYLAILPRYVAGAVLAATHRLEEARLGIGVGHVDSIAFNRRFRMRDGSVATNPGIGNPDIVEPTGPIDPALGVIKATRPDGRLIGLYVNYTVHADVVGGDLISADYPGYLARTLQAVYGPEVVVAFGNGASGNINHINVHGDPSTQRGFAHARRMGTILAGETIRVLEETPVSDEWPLRGAREVLDIPIREVSEEQRTAAEKLLAELADQPERDLEDPTREPYARPRTTSLIEEVYAREALAVHEERQRAGTAPAEVQVLRIGNAVIAANPAELFVEFGLEIKAQSPGRPTFVVELANGCIGYVPTPEAFAQGGYEPRTARSSKLVPEAGAMIVAATQRLLKE